MPSLPSGFSPTLAVNPLSNQIYVSNENYANVTIIDGITNLITQVSVVGFYPGSIAVNPVTDKIYANVYQNPPAVIDGATNQTTMLAAGTNPYLAALNPVTNKIYLGNEDPTNNVVVLDGASNNASYLTVNGEPSAIEVNPVTNRIYIAGAESITVIDGGTDSAVAVVAQSLPAALAANPVTNKVYVANATANSVAGNVSVIDGQTNAATTLPISGDFLSIVVNPVTNRIYAADFSASTVTVIDGESNTVEATVDFGNEPLAMAVNPVTNKIYVVGFNFPSFTLEVIDGATNLTSQIPICNEPASVAVNPTINKIYVGCIGEPPTLAVIDGATSVATSLTVPYAARLAVNQATNKIYAGGLSGQAAIIDGNTNMVTLINEQPEVQNLAVVVNPVTGKAYITIAYGTGDNLLEITEQQVQPVPLKTTITPLPGNETDNPTPTFTFSAQSGTATKPDAIYFQADTWQNSWSSVKVGDTCCQGTIPSLLPGFHILYAYAGDGQEATSTQWSPVTGPIQAYGFLVKPAANMVQVTVAASVPNLSFSVDGTAYSSTQAFTWRVGSQHTIATTQAQTGIGGTQYLFANWSDGRAISHTVTASNLTSLYTANFVTLQPEAYVTWTPLIYSRATRTFNSTFTIYNGALRSIPGPIQLSFSGLAAGVGVANASGAFQGKPFITLSTTGLPLFGSISIDVQFSDPSYVKIQPQSSVYSGVF